MEDSFFGFDTSVPLDDDGGGGQIAEPSEDEYDALNDETFGSAINGDWEEAHENLVRLTDDISCDNGAGGYSINRSRDAGYRDKPHLSSGISTSAHSQSSRLRNAESVADSDLELNLSGMKLDDVDISFSDGDGIEVGAIGGISMDPSVWASYPMKSLNNSNSSTSMKTRNSLFGNVKNHNTTDFLRESFETQSQQQQKKLHIKPELNTCRNSAFGLPNLPHINNAPKICTLEDIERNLIIQQASQKQHTRQQQDQHNQQQLLHDLLKQSPNTPTSVQQHLQKQQQAQPKGPPGFGGTQPQTRSSNNFANNLAQHPFGNLLQQQNMAVNRLPPGFPHYPPGLTPHLQQQCHPQLPPHPLLNQHGLPPNFPHPHSHQRALPNPHLPIALNNFAMHPNFNAMRVAVAAAGIHPAALVPTTQHPPRVPLQPPTQAGVNPQSSNSMYNMFNMRLVQEIQQNHPMLQNTARHMPQNVAVHPQHQQQRSGDTKRNHHRRDGGTANGNLPHEDFDEYSNLMSTRDKHWLIGIQLSQLNTDTPYIDDYYYTVYRERKVALSGNLRHSQAHKDNQLNHPLTQPRGHAQLILVQLGNKNGTRNGQHRERHNSDSGGGTNISSGQDQKTPYVFTPLKFENSLGKLQYGSVTAPRKIIDAEIMSGDGAENIDISHSTPGVCTQSKTGAMTAVVLPLAGGDVTTSAQRKSRHILLHIETLYRIVLKLEDLDNPIAIATIIMKKKKESERIAAFEQLENFNKTPEERAAEASNPQTANPALKNKFAYEIEPKDVLISQLIAGLTHDKIMAMMNVRKGKVLIRRIMPYIEDCDIRWNLWTGIFSSLQNVVKKDREDAEGVLYALYPEFKKQIKKADFKTIVRISASITLNDKKSNGVFCSRFGISSLVCLILQAEKVYVANSDVTFNKANMENWRQFLDQVATSLNRTIQDHTICAAIESDSIQPMINHFARFEDLKLDSLLALITEAKQQIN